MIHAGNESVFLPWLPVYGTSDLAQKAISFRFFVDLATYLFKHLKSASWIYPGFFDLEASRSASFSIVSIVSISFSSVQVYPSLYFPSVFFCFFRFLGYLESLHGLEPSVGVGEISTTAHYPRHYRHTRPHTYKPQLYSKDLILIRSFNAPEIGGTQPYYFWATHGGHSYVKRRHYPFVRDQEISFISLLLSSDSPADCRSTERVACSYGLRCGEEAEKGMR